MCIQNIMYANKIIDTFTFFTIEEHVKKLQAGLLTIESSYLLRLPIRLKRIVAYGLTTKLRDRAIFVIDYSGGSVPSFRRDSLFKLHFKNGVNL